MNALMKKEESMSVEERLAGLESDVKYLRKDVSDLSENVKSVDRKIQDVGAELDRKIQVVGSELDKKIQVVSADLHSFKTDVAKEAGLVRVAIESLKTSTERAKIWMLVAGVGTIISTVITVARTLLKLP